MTQLEEITLYSVGGVSIFLAVTLVVLFRYKYLDSFKTSQRSSDIKKTLSVIFITFLLCLVFGVFCFTYVTTLSSTSKLGKPIQPPISTTKIPATTSGPTPATPVPTLAPPVPTPAPPVPTPAPFVPTIIPTVVPTSPVTTTTTTTSTKTTTTTTTTTTPSTTTTTTTTTCIGYQGSCESQNICCPNLECLYTYCQYPPPVPPPGLPPRPPPAP